MNTVWLVKLKIFDTYILVQLITEFNHFWLFVNSTNSNHNQDQVKEVNYVSFNVFSV